MDQLNLNGFSVNSLGGIVAASAEVAGVNYSNGPDRLKRNPQTANYTALATDNLIVYTALAAARTVTLPAASSVPAGQVLRVKDESGAAAANNITIQRAGSDTIDGANTLVISANFGRATIYSDGVSKWFTL
jgi:hypothetical protein